MLLSVTVTFTLNVQLYELYVLLECFVISKMAVCFIRVFVLLNDYVTVCFIRMFCEIFAFLV